MNLSGEPDNLFLLEQLAEHSDNAFFLFDVSPAKFTYVSPAFEQIWEQSRAGLLTELRRVFQTILPADRQFVLRSWNWYKLPGRGNRKNFEFRIWFPDGRQKWLYAELFLLRNEDQRFCLSGWVRDVSERKNYLEVLRKYAARKNATLEVLTHDLTGFLALIGNLSTGIPETLAVEKPAELAHKLELIRQTCTRGTALIADLVNHEFIESSAVKFNRQRLDLVAKVGDLIAIFQAGQKEMGKTFLVEASAKTIYAEIDDVKFMQVINNLVSNCLKFTPDGGTIRLWLEERPETVLIEITDNGIGIPEALQAKLFDRFTEARRPGLQGEPAIGLGMHIVRSIVEMHHGRIWFRSREHEGTTFFIELPRF